MSSITRSVITRVVRVLIIEDHPGIRGSLELFFELEGHDAKCVDRGEDALSSLQQQSYDLILLDLNTSGMTAFEFMEQFRGLARQGTITAAPVGLISGSIGIELEARRLGTDFWIRKPFEVEEILKMAERYVAPTANAVGFSSPSLSPAVMF